MEPATNGNGRQRGRVIALTIALILLLVALLSDLGQDARDWVTDLWNTLAGRETESASLPQDSADAADRTATGGEGSALTRMLSSLPKNADGALAAAAYQGQAAGSGQPRRASAPAGLIGGAPVGVPAPGSGTTGESAASDAGAPPTDGQGLPTSALALADTGSGGGGGGAAASGGGEFGGGGPFSTVPGGPFVNLTPDSVQGVPQDEPNDTPTSSVPEPGTLLLLASAAVAFGVRRYRRG